MKTEAAWLLGAIAVSAIVATSFGQGNPAASPEPVDISSTLKAILDKHKAPGIVGAILDGDKVTALGAAGVRRVSVDVPMTATDLVHLGSDTKAMTSLLIGQLIDAKQLTLSSTMAEIFPDLAAGMNAAMAKVTVQQLMCHTAGLPANWDYWQYDKTKASMQAQRRAAVKDLLAKAPATDPGKTFTYSNAGFVILGAILEQKTGMSWEQVIKTKLFEPLKMTTAGFGPPSVNGEFNQPWGHSLDGNNLKASQNDNPPVMGPAGRVHCSIEDWAKFVALFDKENAGVPLVSAETMHAILTPPEGKDYAGGWGFSTRPWGGGGVMRHNGSNTMWYCTTWVAPKKGFAVLVAVNLGGDDAAKECDEACSAMIAMHEKGLPK